MVEAYAQAPELALDLVDGLLLTGGRDLDAGSYGAEANPANDASDPLRDRVELALAREAIERGTPLLGVCRGMHVLNVALGGGIDQHLADPDEVHRAEPGTFTSHAVEVVAGSRLEEILGSREATVRSHHHQGVEPLAASLRPSAHSPDGLVEAAETDAGGPYCVAVLWHPEEDLEARRAAALRLADRRGRGAPLRAGDRVSGVRLQRNGEPFDLEPSKIVATHLSYRSRCDEYRMAAPPRWPSYFLKPPSSVSGHEAEVARPRGCRFLNYEGEIAVVIGRRCSGVSRAEALDHVAGYTVANDFGVHDFRHIDRGSMLRVKGQDGFCPLGPALVDAADVDPTALVVRTFVNGERVQEGDTAEDLLFPFDYQVADVSRLITLEPGDVLLTGTPANSRPVEPGDVVEVEVEGIGRLRNRIVELDRDLEDVGAPPEVTAQTLHVALAMPEDQAEAEVAEGKWAE